MIERALGIDGWMAPEELLWLATSAKKHRLILEVGSWLGRSTAAIADNTDGIVYAVDTWRGSGAEHADILSSHGEDWLYREFISHAADNVVPIRMTSLEAAEMFTTQSHRLFDMIFIDGAHDVESVRADLLAWRPLLAEGGLFCGHDYFTTVKEAVDSVLTARIAAHTIWEMV